MNDLIIEIPVAAAKGEDRQAVLNREWLVTNALGGYASGTIGGIATRRYHGLLNAALPAPLGRQMMLNHLAEAVRLPKGATVDFGGSPRLAGSPEPKSQRYLKAFSLQAGLPVWRYEIEGYVLQRRILMPHLQNTVLVSYKLLEAQGAVHLELRPAVHFRASNEPVGKLEQPSYAVTARGDRYELAVNPQRPPLRFYLFGQNSGIQLDGRKLGDILYALEESRGYQDTGELWSPGKLKVELTKQQGASFLASTEEWETALALQPEEIIKAEQRRREELIAAAHPSARSSTGAELVLAADQFIIRPAGRLKDNARAQAVGDEVRTVVAGYHWFTDWGRDTMISLEGLTLTTGRQDEASYIIRAFHDYLRDGLIPNYFPEKGTHGLYNTADATLWFFHAIDRYLATTGDRRTLRLLSSDLQGIIQHHLQGTRLGIGVDPHDGLLHQGAEGYQLTWMDAKVGDWVVTPRRGKAVEINALWYNALRLLEGWLREEENEAAARTIAKHAEQAQRSFNERFWNEQNGYLFDVVDGEDGNDAACRPNQVFSISLKYPVLDSSRWKPVLKVVQDRLLTPVGLRSLDPDDPDYKPQYFGDRRSRDAAYHQGTVWPWLIGPFIDAWLKVHPEDRSGARRLLNGVVADLHESCVGSISEIFDAEAPHIARGCAAQAWSVAEALRCWVKTAPKSSETGS